MSTFNSIPWKVLWFLGLFGILGVYSRFFTSLFINKYFPSEFPSATFAINLLGSFFIGFVFSVAVEKAHFSPALRMGLMIGFLGGFTTFSSFSLEGILLYERGKILYALSYFVLSPILGALCTLCGITLGRKYF